MMPHSCRTAKETLFTADGPKKHPVTILGRGSKLIGGTISVDLDRKAASALLLDGFFPACGLADKPAPKRASGFRELGLPFESDTLAGLQHARLKTQPESREARKAKAKAAELQ